MATYYNGNSEIQGGDGLQTLVLMNPGYIYYPDSQQSTQPPPANLMFLDSNHPGNNPHMAVGQQPPPSAQTQQFVGIPLSASPPSSVHSQHDVSSLHTFIPRAQYMYNPGEMVATREATPFQQGLSLSLSSQQSRYGTQGTRVPVSPTGDDVRAGITGGPGGGGGSTSSASGISNNGMHNMLLNSKYLKATQEILEEVVNVGKVALKNSDESSKSLKISGTGGDGGSPPAPPVGAEAADTAKSGGATELTTAERQEIQMKKAKLVNMLDEVEQRYRQYHHQMLIVISWFEQAAGTGAAKTYTALALQTISKQFRCLKDAIMGQIKAASRSLGEEDSLTGGGKPDGSGSRLKFVDNQLRQQRALQQLGMIQHNAWRPQRGLPERSVSVLRAWLFEHFLHPYPKDSDKHMLAKQTGLTRSQVSNWFINARVRLWKPMVEEMYLEEIKEHEQNGKDDTNTSKNDENEDNSSSKQGKTPSPENSNRGFRTAKQENAFHPPPSMTASTSVSTSPTGIQFQNPSGFSLIDGITQFSPKKPRNNEQQQQNQNQHDTGFTLTGGNPTDFMSGLGGYPVGEIGRFTANQFQQQFSGNGVSLTLGLPDCENLSMSGTHQSFLSNQNIQLRRGAELGEEHDYTAMNPPSSSHTAALYESMNIQNRKRFAAQPLPDFVA
ncbi:putative transcription factor Homeodomain-TALE-BEL family [Helianthus annuus]|uniref:Putative POX domain, Homeobox KN domain-containing protein n=1 Tax=Helianthus annuus TaxID=4232 RepID=A0A251VIL5_HELAN|nr:BEL1-like homeodomain protein 1 [Helianthus annuus]KAF5819529.1 putative transcription factor Homeodomain-TALE-BEL family [Helianthus annuus]KAJ0605668.1 putative transcription factor Homeodomain-TALE-BEL family [Helianthus annuus]KAJ0616518.1 putative transcription factor Homeodomain-TALE-BEL family [Helianthus annuus]KAJ0619684.1 putative transcription factor Homeodomain-TALE-BEL family [Helianthus annuus]KAJ0787143.1 putative transcription factor Homeodomain-TALE-BEL family [Helianthus a